LPAPPRPPADAPVGINAVAATKAVAAKQQITDLGDMGFSPFPAQFLRNCGTRGADPSVLVITGWLISLRHIHSEKL
jgi:hypothetical protein